MNLASRYSKRLLEIAQEIRPYNIREFFIRKINYDSTRKYENLSEEDLKNEVETLTRIKIVQNLYYTDSSEKTGEDKI